MTTENKALARRVARLEARLGAAEPKRKTSVRGTLLAEIDELGERLGMSFMDDDMDNDLDAGMTYMDDEVSMDDELDMAPMPVGEDVVMEEDLVEAPMSYMDDEMEPGCMRASEMAPGIEDEITQDSLQEVEDLRGKEGLATQPDANAAARNTTPPEGSHPMWASRYVKKLKRASVRLDAIATHVEKSGDQNLALRIDRIADAIDKRANQVVRGA